MTHQQGGCTTRLEGLCVSKGNLEILKDINLEVRCGELTALVGPNGAGKSTLLKAILGEVRHTGRISFRGDGDEGILPRAPAMGYVPQRLELDASSPTSVLDIITATRSLAPVWLVKTRKARRHAEGILSTVQAEHLVDRQVGALSGGELQRVLLALALDPVPRLLLLDEPVSGVDLKGLAMFYETVARLRREYDLSIILVSHDLGLVAEHADRVVFLDKTVVSSGTAREVFASEAVLSAFGEGAYRNVGMVPSG